MERISFRQALDLLKNAPLEELRAYASQVRHLKHPDNRVSYVIDANPNYTNVCNVYCKFCAFYRKELDDDAYLWSTAKLREELAIFRNAGIKTVLLQGGVHPKVSMTYLKDLLEITVREFPEIHPHFFSAVEIAGAAKVSKISIESALKMLWDSGQRTIPGGGAEILSEHIRLKISPRKLTPGGWINFHKTAHKIGFLTTATMMFGHVERLEDIILHLECLRNTQDEYQGFTSFIPWSYKLPNTKLRTAVSNQALPEMYYRILAVARIYLDNFPHIAASWFGEGKDYGTKGLGYGANDFGGTVFGESVHRCANWDITVTQEEIRRLISEEGYQPFERNSFYEDISLRTAFKN